ncbi:hypothetical protein J4211_02550 [Candidatus Woesearchaeota archaeon]|nr:hypothetical protein [Candidatus Woesearchaeota archaeon]
MKHVPAHYPANYGPRPYGHQTHFKRNVIIGIIILFFLPGIPAFINSGFSVAVWFSAALAYWQGLASRIGS